MYHASQHSWSNHGVKFGIKVESLLLYNEIELLKLESGEKFMGG